MTLLAITGGTGFVGGHLLRLGRERGLTMRALTRRPQAPLPGVTWVEGALDDAASLAVLTAGADAVIHVAGVINATDRAGFLAGNVSGTETLLAAAANAGVRRFVHVSSLAAREPELSNYGWSKALSERSVAAAPLDWTIVRPPAIYGPGDSEMLELFRMARRGVVPLPPGGRISLIAVEDLCRLLLDLPAASQSVGLTLEPDDGVTNGWDHRDFARALGGALGRRVIPLSLPAAMLHTASLLDGFVRRGKAKLTRDRVRYFCHPDWVVANRPDPALWQPAIPTPEGLRATADWYRREGWL
jgi:nucleoside-diphosphate-sugar epimerase